MSKVQDGLTYTKNHEWLYTLGNSLYKIGVTDHTQLLLGEIIFVDLPGTDKVFVKGESCAIIESAKAAADVCAPITGVVVRINKKLEHSPFLINREPYKNGWLFILKINNEGDLNNLLSATQYQKYIQEIE